MAIARANQFDIWGKLKSAHHTLGAEIKLGQVPLFSELQGGFADRYEFTISLILATS